MDRERSVSKLFIDLSDTLVSDVDLPAMLYSLARGCEDVATIGILQERSVSAAELRADQLQHALERRILIEQAKGMLAERLAIEPSTAFERIRSHARSRSMKLREVCHQVVEEGLALTD